MALPRTISVGLIGAGRIGSSHANLIARRVPGANLVAIADPRSGVVDADDAVAGHDVLETDGDLHAPATSPGAATERTS